MPQWIKRISILTLALFISYALWLVVLSFQIGHRLKEGWFLPPVEIYSSPEHFWAQKSISPQQFIQKLKQQDFETSKSSRLSLNEFIVLGGEACAEKINLDDEEIPETCIEYQPNATDLHLIAFAQNKIYKVYSGTNYAPVPFVPLKPELFAHFYGEQPLQKQIVPLSETPLQCLQAITAIEDQRFLDHQGISFVGILRATLKNIINFGVKEGASTITQQLVKNYFLTPERTFSRKIKEISMALIIELKFDKDTILENYLNVIYMGQNSSFQIRGYAAAARHYFNKPLRKLNLNECAVLAALVNSPGRYNPYTKPEATLKRRSLVLQKMLETQMISSDEFEQAHSLPLPISKQRKKVEPAAYYVQAIFKELKSLDIDTEAGLKVYSSLNTRAQSLARKSIQKGLKQLESQHKKVKKNLEQGLKLQASLVSLDTHSGAVLALVGGRDYRDTQYNRVLEAHRQVGSIMKPLVYAAALETLDEEGQEYNALSIINDETFTHKYDRQSWSPKNYSKTTQGPVPLFYALKNSLNIPTAKLGLKIGLDTVVDLAHRLGVESEIHPLPSLSLGSYELYTYEVAQAYSSIANMGKEQKIHWIKEVKSLDGESIYKHKPESRQVLAPEVAAELISMLKQTLLTGTARSLPNFRGFALPAAGKTGTTSDTKDAWFVGFTPHILTIVWVGYDNNASHGLTGASGAVPIWAQFMNRMTADYPADDFNWPENMQKINLSAEDLKEKITDLKDHEAIDTKIVIRKHLDIDF